VRTAGNSFFCFDKQGEFWIPTKKHGPDNRPRTSQWQALLYALNTFPLGVHALDQLDPTHHQHNGVGWTIMLSVVMCANFIHCVMNFMTRIENSYCQSSIHAYDMRIPQCYVLGCPPKTRVKKTAQYQIFLRETQREKVLKASKSSIETWREGRRRRRKEEEEFVTQKKIITMVMKSYIW